ncbi:hypothetical protein Tcan_01040, partial [Toxocara canis]
QASPDEVCTENYADHAGDQTETFDQKNERSRTEELISLIESEIAVKRRLSNILNFSELYSETPCVQVLDSWRKDEKRNTIGDAINKTEREAKLLTANMRLDRRSHCGSYKNCESPSNICSKCSEFILFRERIIMR